MTVEQMRQALMDVYPGLLWHKKVKKMSESQVTAIYLRLKQQNKL